MVLDRTRKALKKGKQVAVAAGKVTKGKLVEKKRLREELENELGVYKIPRSVSKKKLKKIKEEVQATPGIKENYKDAFENKKFLERMEKSASRLVLEDYLNQYDLPVEVKRLTRLKKIDDVLIEINELENSGASEDEIRNFLKKRLRIKEKSRGNKKAKVKLSGGGSEVSFDMQDVTKYIVIFFLLIILFMILGAIFR